MKTRLLRIISILILATIVLTQRWGLGAGAAMQAKHPVEPAAPALSTTTRVSVASDGSQGDNESGYPSISADGRYVVFSSSASNLVIWDTNGVYDIFVHDRQTGNTQRVSVASDGSQGNNSSWTWKPSISTGGRYVAFYSEASNLVIGDTNDAKDIFVHDRQTGSTRRVSVANDGGQGNGSSWEPSISADGRYVVFYSEASNLVSGDTNFSFDTFVHDLQTSSTERVSVTSDGKQENGSSWHSVISPDGRYIAFTSNASNLVSGDTNGEDDIFVHDRQTGITERVSVASDGRQGDGLAGSSSISADGRYVAFGSWASNLVTGDTNGAGDVFVHDRQTGSTERVSVASDGSQSDGWYPSISADGSFVGFISQASNLVAGDTNGVIDVFVHDRQNGSTQRVSVASDGSQGNDSSGYYDGPSISVNGRYVVFASYANNLVSEDTNGAGDVFVHDREGRNFVFYLPVTQNQP